MQETDISEAKNIASLVANSFKKSYNAGNIQCLKCYKNEPKLEYEKRSS